MKDKICIVTGANAGIGKATAQGLADLGASVVMVCRSRERGERAREEITAETGNAAVELLIADLAVQQQIRDLVQEFKARFSELHVLINNAGVITKKRSVTEDGLETQFAVNHLAGFLLTNLLLDTLKATGPARIINVSSSTHFSGEIDFDDPQAERAYDPIRVYANTKLANVLFTYELARRLDGTDVTANCLTPGVVSTKMLDEYMGTSNAPGASPEEGAETPIYLACSDDVTGVSGKYFKDCRPVRSAKASYDSELAKKLWEVSARLTGFWD